MMSKRDTQKQQATAAETCNQLCLACLQQLRQLQNLLTGMHVSGYAAEAELLSGLAYKF